MSYSADFTLNLGPSNSGLTLKAAIVGPDLTLVAKDISIAGEIGGGSYFAHLTLADGQRGFVAFYSGTVGGGSDLSGVVIKGLAALDAELENSGQPAMLADGAVRSAAIADGAITSAKFSVASISSLANATGLLEQITSIWRWCFKRKTGPFTSAQVINGQIQYYADDNSTPIGQQAAVDDGVGEQTVGAVEDVP
jgi:hypothetical protein